MYAKSHWRTENTSTQNVLTYGVFPSRKLIDKSQYLFCILSYFTIREGAKRKFFFIVNTIFCGSCIPKSLLLKDSPMNKVLQVAQRLERTKTGWSMIKNIGEKGVKEVEINKIDKIWEKQGNPKPIEGQWDPPKQHGNIMGLF